MRRKTKLQQQLHQQQQHKPKQYNSSLLILLYLIIIWSLILSMSLAQDDFDICNTIVINTPTPSGVGCTCNSQAGLVECTTTRQYCVEPDEEEVQGTISAAALKEEEEKECASELSLQLFFGGGSDSNILQQWSQLSRVTTCLQGYTKNGQPIVDEICYDMELCYDDDDDASICGCAVQYNQQTCQECVPCPDGRGILVDCTNLDDDFVSIACVSSLRFVSEWRSIDIRDDKDRAEMVERYQEDWQDQASDFMEDWQEGWDDLLPRTIFRTQQLCDALHDYTTPVLDGDNMMIEVSCDCQNAVLNAELGDSYIVNCQSTTPICDGSLCGTVQTEATIVDGEVMTLQSCTDYNNDNYQQACLLVEICNVNEQEVLCNPAFTYGGVACTATLCNDDGTSITVECSNSSIAADITFATCQEINPDGLMRFIPIIASGGGDDESNVSDTPVPATVSPTATAVLPATSPPFITPILSPNPTIVGTSIPTVDSHSNR
jgi:hypothetical protein